MIIHQDKDQLTDKLYRLNLTHSLLYLEIQFDMDLGEQQSSFRYYQMHQRFDH